MRQNGAPVPRLALLAGLLLVVGVAAAPIARAADTARQPWLGVYMQEMTTDLRDTYDYDGPGGVIVSRVVTGGPAEKAGLRRDDVIVRLNGRLVDTPAELTEIVREAGVGQRMSVQVSRDGSYRTLSVTLGSRSASGEPGSIQGEAPNEPEAPEAPQAPWPQKRIVIKSLDDLEGLDVLRDLPGGGQALLAMAGRGRLGVRVESLSPALGEYFGLRDGKGALVLEVLEGRPAEKAGLVAGDVITRVGDKAVGNSRDLVEVLRGKEGKVALRVVRHGTPRTIEATLDKAGTSWGEAPDTPSSGSPGVQKRIILRGTDREDLRHELDQLKQEVEKLKQRLDDESDEGEE